MTLLLKQGTSFPCPFTQVSGEKNRFEKLMEYFSNDDSNIDFMVRGHKTALNVLADVFAFTHNVVLKG